MTDKQYETIVNKLNFLQATVEALARRSVQEHSVPSVDAIPTEHLSSFSEVRKEILLGIQQLDKISG